MSVEIHDSLIALLAEVASLKEKETALKAEKARQLETIAAAEGEVTRCNGELDDIRENQLRLRRAMDDLKNDLFRRDDEETITLDPSHTPSEEGASGESEGKKLWNDRQKLLKSVT